MEKWHHIFAVKQLTRVCWKNALWFTKFLTGCKHIATVKNFRITTKQSLCDTYDVHMIRLIKMLEVEPPYVTYVLIFQFLSLDSSELEAMGVAVNDRVSSPKRTIHVNQAKTPGGTLVTTTTTTTQKPMNVRYDAHIDGNWNYCN